jgi:hypothetical protein
MQPSLVVCPLKVIDLEPGAVLSIIHIIVCTDTVASSVQMIHIHTRLGGIVSHSTNITQYKKSPWGRRG